MAVIFILYIYIRYIILIFFWGGERTLICVFSGIKMVFFGYDDAMT